jgi:hypothetical protein
MVKVPVPGENTNGKWQMLPVGPQWPCFPKGGPQGASAKTAAAAAASWEVQ